MHFKSTLKHLLLYIYYCVQVLTHRKDMSQQEVQVFKASVNNVIYIIINGSHD